MYIILFSKKLCILYIVCEIQFLKRLMLEQPLQQIKLDFKLDYKQ